MYQIKLLVTYLGSFVMPGIVGIEVVGYLDYNNIRNQNHVRIIKKKIDIKLTGALVGLDVGSDVDGRLVG